MTVMPICCPNCAHSFPLIDGLNDADARRVAALMGQVPPKLAGLVLQYLQLFKPPKSGLTWRRTHKLLDQLVPMIRAGQVERHGRTWAAPAERWEIALQQIIDRREKFTLPLKSHGYLLEILAGLSNSEEAATEQQTENRRRNRAPAGGSEDVKTPGMIRSEIKSLEQMIASTASEANKARLREQMDELRQQLEEDSQ